MNNNPKELIFTDNLKKRHKCILHISFYNKHYTVYLGLLSNDKNNYNPLETITTHLPSSGILTKFQGFVRKDKRIERFIEKYNLGNKIDVKEWNYLIPKTVNKNYYLYEFNPNILKELNGIAFKLASEYIDTMK